MSYALRSALLFTFNPFNGPDSYPAPGPIFIHASSCVPCPTDSIPPSLRTLPLLAEGFTSGGWPVARATVHDGDVENAGARLFTNESVDYVHLRHGQAGCFIARLERLT